MRNEQYQHYYEEHMRDFEASDLFKRLKAKVQTEQVI